MKHIYFLVIHGILTFLEQIALVFESTTDGHPTMLRLAELGRLARNVCIDKVLTNTMSELAGIWHPDL